MPVPAGAQELFDSHHRSLLTDVQRANSLDPMKPIALATPTVWSTRSMKSLVFAKYLSAKPSKGLQSAACFAQNPLPLDSTNALSRPISKPMVLSGGTDHHPSRPNDSVQVVPPKSAAHYLGRTGRPRMDCSSTSPTHLTLDLGVHGLRHSRA